MVAGNKVHKSGISYTYLITMGEQKKRDTCNYMLEKYGSRGGSSTSSTTQSPILCMRSVSIKLFITELAFSIVQMYKDFFFLRFLGGIWPLWAAYSSTMKSNSKAKLLRPRTWKRKKNSLTDSLYHDMMSCDVMVWRHDVKWRHAMTLRRHITSRRDVIKCHEIRDKRLRALNGLRPSVIISCCNVWNVCVRRSMGQEYLQGYFAGGRVNAQAFSLY